MTFREFKALSSEVRTAYVNNALRDASAAKTAFDKALANLLSTTAHAETVWVWRESLREV